METLRGDENLNAGGAQQQGQQQKPQSQLTNALYTNGVPADQRPR